MMAFRQPAVHINTRGIQYKYTAATCIITVYFVKALYRSMAQSLARQSNKPKVQCSKLSWASFLMQFFNLN